jgi:hypothetical protein
MKLLSVLAAMTALALSDATAVAQAHSRTWTEEKCVRYRTITEDVMAAYGGRLSAGFREAHRAFLERGCDDPRSVCPVIAADFEAANRLTDGAIRAGMAGTFLPFACGKAR